MSLTNGFAPHNGHPGPIVATTTDGRGLTEEEWHAERNRDYGIGASDLPKIALGPSFELWHQKRGYLPADRVLTEPMWWGKRLEELICERWCMNTGELVTQQQIFARHPTMPWLYSTLDALTIDGEPREWKSTGLWGQDEDERGLSFDEENPPARWIIQAHGQMLVTGADDVRIGVFYGPELCLKECWVRRNSELMTHLIFLVNDFHESLILDRAPRAGHHSDAAILARLNKRDDGPSLDWLADATLSEAVRQFHEASEAKKTWEKARERFRGVLLQAIGNSKLATVNGYTLKRSVSKSGAVTLEAKPSDVQAAPSIADAA